jgi:Tfp pilus assembly protein PilW
MSRSAHRIIARRPGGRARSRGLTLIEFSIATLLLLIVMTATLFAYASQRTSQRLAQDLAQTQGNGRIALEQIGRDIRQAGYIGCNSALQRHVDPRVGETRVIPIDPALAESVTNFSIDAQTALRAFPGSAIAAVSGTAAPAGVVANSHVIEVRYANLDGATRLAADVPVNGLTLTTMGTFEPSRGDLSPQSTNRLGLLSDCQSAVVVSIATVADTLVSIDATRPLTGARCGHASRIGSGCVYRPSTTLYPIRVVQYYVTEQTVAGVAQRTLMMRTRRMSSAAIEWEDPQALLAGVVDLRVTGLGLDRAHLANSDPTYTVVRQLDELTDGSGFLPADDSDEWRRVARLDLRLRMRTRTAGAGGEAPLIRNFESSYMIRSRVTVDP